MPETSNRDTSTIADNILKSWADNYPKDKVDKLYQQADTIEKLVVRYKEQLTSLKAAKQRLGYLTDSLPPVLSLLNTAISKHTDFVETYGTLGIELKIPTSTLKDTIEQYVSVLADYAVDVDAAYFQNLNEVSQTLEYVSAIQNFYKTLADIITSITENYLKTKPDRRRPLVRELTRLFKALRDNYLFQGVNPSSQSSKLLTNPLPSEEYKTICKIQEEARYTADLLSKSR